MELECKGTNFQSSSYKLKSTVSSVVQVAAGKDLESAQTR